jgi:hypothetical protein
MSTNTVKLFSYCKKGYCTPVTFRKKYKIQNDQEKEVNKKDQNGI